MDTIQIVLITLSAVTLFMILWVVKDRLISIINGMLSEKDPRNDPEIQERVKQLRTDVGDLLSENTYDFVFRNYMILCREKLESKYPSYYRDNP